MTKEMIKVLDSYFGTSASVSGTYPAPYSGFRGNLTVTVRRADVERSIVSGELDKRPVVLDVMEQIKKTGSVPSGYFPWIAQRAKELMK